uniref:Photosystem I assembly protein Ycf4 n=1 Tax=Polysiphonia sertularioides TaxID=945028 RepID=A0A1Z1M8Q0_9FLOR|nr:photosystem I assembly protein [Polysiphonia sertularioides]ARW62467.1 photosystem I assembly protein [Polysiphonia sertularioides]
MTIKTYKIKGSRRFSNYWWASIILIGGTGFFLVGITSYKSFSLYINASIQNISFIPQGAIMTFYGLTAILISCFLWYTIFFDVGSGYNEFNKITGVITIFRFGFPGKNRILKLKYKLQDIIAIKISIQEGLSPKREIYLKMIDKRQIPLTKVGEPMSLSDIEQQAKDIAVFLNVNVEGKY